jgi:hypothetical protein
MVKTADAPAQSRERNEKSSAMPKVLAFAQDLLGPGDALRPADVEPQALMDGAEASTGGDRPVPEDVGREGPSGSSPANRRFDTIWMPVKTKGATPLALPSLRAPVAFMWKSPRPLWQFARASGTSRSSASIRSSSQLAASSLSASTGPSIQRLSELITRKGSASSAECLTRPPRLEQAPAFVETICRYLSRDSEMRLDASADNGR